MDPQVHRQKTKLNVEYSHTSLIYLIQTVGAKFYIGKIALTTDDADDQGVHSTRSKLNSCSELKLSTYPINFNGKICFFPFNQLFGLVSVRQVRTLNRKQ